MVVPTLPVFQGGQMTDLPEYDGAYDATALLELVAPGNAELGVNYSITLALLVQFIVAGIADPVIITDTTTAIAPYPVPDDVYRVLFNQTVAGAGYADIGGGAARSTPVMVRSLKSDTDVNPITVSFTGTCDGLASPIVISAPYGGFVFNPLPNGNWYLTNT